LRLERGTLPICPVSAILRFGSKSVTSASFSVVRPNDLTTARLVEPTPTGPAEVIFSSSAFDDHFGVSSTLLSTAKTSSTDRLMVMLTSAFMLTSHSGPD